MVVKFILLFLVSFSVLSNDKVIDKWLGEFKESTLSEKEKRKELKWFINASKPYKGLTIKVVSERIDTHWYEANTLSLAFKELTGINVVHEITGEDDVVKKIQTQTSMEVNLYDAFINDSDFIGTHFRSGEIYTISDLIKNAPTLPTLDIKDFIGLKFTSASDGVIYQLPDQQFANLYWYRADWFARDDLKKQFKSIYGYELNVPENWSAYEDIAEFFTEHVKTIDNVRVYGHSDYGKKDPSIGWRFSDSWLSMAGVGDKGLPNGLPVDEWGVRVEGCSPVGASVRRGGAANSPAAIYAIRKFNEWLKKYAPPGAEDMNFSQAGALPAKGNIAQQIFWYTAFTAALTKPGLPVVNDDGTPKWKMAPSPHGAYWEKGMKLGYQDVGAWTFLKGTDKKKREAAWLYAQFSVSKTVSLKKTIKGLTPIRLSDIYSKEFTKMAPRLGGLVEFYQSKGRNYWTPTGTNIPDYPNMSLAWWRTIPKVISGKLTPEQTMNELASYLDRELSKVSKNNPKMKCRPKLNPIREKKFWLNKKGSPKKKLLNEKPPGRTYDFDTAIKVYE